ncbi:hypothetical protein BDV06DRAFT_161961 [Aspergillus oleicola]
MLDDLNKETSETLASLSSSLPSMAQPSPVDFDSTACGPVSPFTSSLDIFAGQDAAQILPASVPDNVDPAFNSPWSAFPWETLENSAHILHAQPNDLTSSSSVLFGMESSKHECFATFMQANSSCTLSSPDDEIPQPILNDLYQCYLDKAHGSCPIVERSSFLMRLRSDPIGPEVLSLKYISLAHGALLSRFHKPLHASLYRKARRIFDQIDKGGVDIDIDITMNVVYLQACILLALYELMHAQFLRARSTTIRALAMASALGLDKIDQPFSPFSDHNVNDAAGLEEWRRVFWGLVNLCFFVSASIGGNIDIPFDFAEIKTFLPVDTSLSMPLAAPAGIGLNLQDADNLLAEQGSTSPTQGLILSTALLGQCLVHKNKLSKDQNQDDEESSQYNFWMHQYRLTESLGHISNAFAVDSNHIPFIMDTESLSINMNIQAARIWLDRAATRGFASGAAGGNASIFPRLHSKDRYMKAALEITNIAQQMRHLDLARVSPFTPWAIHAAAEVFVRDILAAPAPTSADRRPGTSTSTSTSTKSSCSSSLSFSSVPTGSADSLQNLLVILSRLKTVNPIAGSMEAQIRLEITGVKALSDG